MALNITRGRVPHGIKAVIYGPEGIGKTTLAAQFPGAVFIDTEGSTGHFDVLRLPKPTSWEMLKAEAAEVLSSPGEVGTLIIDTADWADALCARAICEKGGKAGIEDFGYGKGYTYQKEEFGRLLDTLSQVSGAGVNVVFTAHAVQKRVDLPDQLDSFDRYELKCSKQVSPLLKEWADMVLFLNYRTIIVQTKDKKNKPQGGERIMHTTHRPAWDAKNRFGLPDELPLDFGAIAHLFQRGPAPAPVAPPPPDMTVAGTMSTTPPPEQPAPVPVAPPVEVPAVSAAQEAEAQSNEANINPMTGEDIYAGIYPPLADLLRTKNISPVDIQDIVHGAGILPKNPDGSYIEVRDYPEGLCQEIVARWDSFWALSEQYCKLPF